MSILAAQIPLEAQRSAANAHPETRHDSAMQQLNDRVAVVATDEAVPFVLSRPLTQRLLEIVLRRVIETSRA